MRIQLDDLSGADIQALLAEHLAQMRSQSPPESVHALDLSGLKQADVSFWTGWIDGRLAACGALKTLTPEHGEIKSMRTSAAFRGQGAGRLMLMHIAEQARASHAAAVPGNGVARRFPARPRALRQFWFCGMRPLRRLRGRSPQRLHDAATLIRPIPIA